jgi:hypothetical protein
MNMILPPLWARMNNCTCTRAYARGYILPPSAMARCVSLDKMSAESTRNITSRRDI